MVPGEILMAGSEPALQRYRFSLESESAAKVELSCGSAFCVGVHGDSGTIAVCGSHGCTLLSQYGTRLGRIAS